MLLEMFLSNVVLLGSKKWLRVCLVLSLLMLFVVLVMFLVIVLFSVVIL